jgi:hypothetical protein
MATIAQQTEGSLARRLSVSRVAIATSLSALAFVVLCWLGAIIGFGPANHMFISLFSGAETNSFPALLIAVCWAFFGGAIIGAVYATIYNVLAPLER